MRMRKFLRIRLEQTGGIVNPLAAGCRVATVGQLLFAPWAWAYSTLHPLGDGK